MKFDLYTAKSKTAADGRMTDAAISRRFANDKGYDKGDWGRADKKYAPGATYDHEMKTGKIIESEATGHPEYHSTFQHHGYEHVGSKETSQGTVHTYKKGNHTVDAQDNHKSNEPMQHHDNWGGLRHRYVSHHPVLGPTPGSTKQALDQHLWMRNAKHSDDYKPMHEDADHRTSNGDHKKNPFHKILTKHGYEHQSTGVHPIGVGVEHSYKHPTNGGTVKVGHIGSERSWHHEGIGSDNHGHMLKGLEHRLGAYAKDRSMQESKLMLRGVLAEAMVFEAKHNPINQKGTLLQRLKKKLQMEDDVPSPDELKKADDGKPVDGKEVLDELGEAKQMKFDKGAHVRALARASQGQPKPKSIIVSKKDKPEKHKGRLSNYD